MRNSVAWLLASLAAASLCTGCQKEESGTASDVPPGVSAVDFYAADLTHMMDVNRIIAAENLAKLPASELKKAIPALERALAKEKAKGPKQAMERALAAAKAAG